MCLWVDPNTFRNSCQPIKLYLPRLFYSFASYSLRINVLMAFCYDTDSCISYIVETYRYVIALNKRMSSIFDVVTCWNSNITTNQLKPIQYSITCKFIARDSGIYLPWESSPREINIVTKKSAKPFRISS